MLAEVSQARGGARYKGPAPCIIFQGFISQGR